MELIETLRATVSGDDDRGVSPVIGVILMVAITVILAAVIATFVLGLGEQVSSTAPQVTVSWNQSTNTTGGFDAGATHNGGGTLVAKNVKIKADNATSITQPTDIHGSDGEIQAGDTIGVAKEVYEGDKIRVVWQSPNGDTTATIGEYTVQG